VKAPVIGAVLNGVTVGSGCNHSYAYGYGAPSTNGFANASSNGNGNGNGRQAMFGERAQKGARGEAR